MWNRLCNAALLAAAVTWASGATVARGEEDDAGGDDEGGEVHLRLDQVPEAVRKALKKEAGGAKFDTVEREVEGGKTVYEIEVVIDGKTWGIEVDQNGKLLEKELEDGEDEAEDDDDGGEAGAGAKSDAKAEAKDDVEENDDDAESKGDAKAAAKRNAKAAEDDDAADDEEAEDGDADEDEEQVQLDQLPEKVGAALKKAAGGGTIGEIERETEGGKTVYEAEVTVGGKTWEITFAGDGKVLEKELDDDDDEEGDEDEAEDDDD